MLLMDVKTQEDVKKFVAEDEGHYRETVPFHKQLDYRAKMPMLKNHIKVELKTMAEIVESFMDKNLNEIENTEKPKNKTMEV